MHDRHPLRHHMGQHCTFHHHINIFFRWANVYFVGYSSIHHHKLICGGVDESPTKWTSVHLKKMIIWNFIDLDICRQNSMREVMKAWYLGVNYMCYENVPQESDILERHADSLHPPSLGRVNQAYSRSLRCCVHRLCVRRVAISKHTSDAVYIMSDISFRCVTTLYLQSGVGVTPS